MVLIRPVTGTFTDDVLKRHGLIGQGIYMGCDADPLMISVSLAITA